MANLIFDLDGTLIDSYPAIIEKAKKVIAPFNIDYDYQAMKETFIKGSTSAFFRFVANDQNLGYENLMDGYQNIKEDITKIKLIPGVKETLTELAKRGHNLFIFTHRGKSFAYISILDEINPLMKEIVTSENGFARKPNPQGVLYLINKYKLNPSETYYVGDRPMDIDCAINAKIKSVFFDFEHIIDPSTIFPTKRIEKFEELKDIF